MAKKLEVWLNNKLNKCLHCAVVIKFYRIFVTELVFTFFVFKYQNHFEFPKDGKWSPCFKILEIPEGRGRVIKDSLEQKILGGGGGGGKSKSFPWWGYGYFLEPHISSSVETWKIFRSMLCQFFFTWAAILSEKNPYFGKHLLLQNEDWLRVQASCTRLRDW